MQLIINGQPVTAQPGQSLLDMVRQMGLITGKLSADPLAAKIAGEIFTLNYIPLRQKDVCEERESIRKAMAASGGKVQLLYYQDPTGKDAYTRTAQFVLFLALWQLWPKARATMNCTVGAGLYIKVTGAQDFTAQKVKEQVQKIVEQDIPLLRHRITTQEAIDYYTAQGQDDKAQLLAYRQIPTLDVYKHGDFADYYYGEMAPSTGFLRVWDILEAPDGFMFIFPNDLMPDRVATYRESPNLFSVYTEGRQWGELMECETVADLNELVDSGRDLHVFRI